MTTTIRFVLLATVLLVGACGPKKSDTKDEAESENKAAFKGSDTKGDAEWAVDVADAGMLEVRVAELAQTNAQSSDVKSFATMMSKDHSMANDELKALAEKKGISLPAGLSNSSQNKYDDLSKKTGHDFDEAYADMMVDDHKKTVDAFKKEADKGNDPDLKSWASGKIATLEHHLEMAKQTEEKTDKEKKK